SARPPSPTTSGTQANQEQALKIFQRLLENLKLSPDLANKVAAWINNDPSGSADLEYLAKNPPYRAAQRRLVDVAELVRIKDFDEKTMQILAPHVTALDKNPPVNINTASREVLRALFKSSVAETIINSRSAKPYINPPTTEPSPDMPCPLTSC